MLSVTIDGLVREGAFRRAMDRVNALALGAVRAGSRLAPVGETSGSTDMREPFTGVLKVFRRLV